MAWRDRLAALQEVVEERTGLVVQPRTLAEATAARSRAYGEVRRELDLLGWSVLDYVSGNPQELTPQARRQWVQQARMVWRQDPQAGAAVDLMNDFVLGRGVPKPNAKDNDVQDVIDEAWDDPDNRLVLTSYDAQLALNTDLTLQCNLFVLLFEGEDGKVKLGLLNHDEVETAVRDPENRLRVLYYMAAKRSVKWNFQTDAPEFDMQAVPKRMYFEHWRNMEVLRETDGRDTADLEVPEEKKGDGRVYHVAINRGSEEVFGNPSMRRLIRWFSAYNDFLSARVDMMQAAAAFMMRRKVKGTPNQVAKMAAKAISRQSELAGVTGTGDSPAQMPPRSGSIISENEGVSHEQMKIDSGAGGASQDAQMLRAAISAGVRFPQSYLGDPSNSNLATATSLELPVLKAVENRQEIMEGLFRWFIDRAIQRAVDSGRLSKSVARAESGEQPPVEPGSPDDTGAFGPPPFTPQEAAQRKRLSEYEGEGEDEQDTERDLSYEFGMPSPLKRMMADLVGAITNIAKTFDPNGTNMELNRALLTIALGDALEVQEPGDVVEKIFPEGYVDPAIAAAQAQAEAQQAPPPPTPEQAPQPGIGAGGQQPGNAAPGTSQEYQDSQGQMQQGLSEARYADLPPEVRRARDRHIESADTMLDDELDVAATRLGRSLASRNGKH